MDGNYTVRQGVNTCPDTRGSRYRSSLKSAVRRKGGDRIVSEIGRAMVRAGIVSAEQLQEAEEEKRREKVKKICEDIGRRFPNTPDIFKILIFLAENKMFKM